MTTFTRGARVGALVISVVLLLLVPGIAAATFSGSRAAPMDVSTATMVAPSGVSGTYACSRGGANETISISVSGFTDAGPAGAQYLYTLRLGTSVKATSTSATRTATLTHTQLRDLSSNTWTIDIQAKLGSWTSPVTSRTAVCAEGSKQSGNL